MSVSLNPSEVLQFPSLVQDSCVSNALSDNLMQSYFSILPNTHALDMASINLHITIHQCAVVISPIKTAVICTSCVT